ncbi:hypothetical protein BS50DRAFT_546300 [Corynespora cassiicola Philippines]|uniref:C2H2-type domain-containing protein n=1 Tax=Corynespora cassiicola Philippines TaxID=1448308 RepID=A0A2T2P0L0_CORCC|nr:hypothetical protein BS50DRAFT_546300 [Corynespora cassiicola Philippines]
MNNADSRSTTMSSGATLTEKHNLFSSGSTTPSTSSSLQNALVSFRNKLKGDELEEFRSMNYHKLCQEIYKIQNEQESTKKMMNLNRIQSFLEAMDQFGKTIEVFLNVADVVAFIWGPIKFLLLTASNFTDSFESLLDAYEQIGENLPMLTKYERLFHENDYMRSALELMYIDILEFHMHAKRFFSGPAWRKVFKSVWKDFGSSFGGILKRLERHKKLIETRADLSQFQRYQLDMLELKATLAKVVEEEKSKMIREVKDRLAVTPQYVDHENFCNIRKEFGGTGNWFVKNDLVKDWLDGDPPVRPLCWLKGIPGAGKTILASLLVEECCKRKHRKGGDFLTSYIYCHYDAQDRNTAVGVFKGLIDQMLDQYPDLIPFAHSRCVNSGEPVLQLFSTVKKLLEDLCSQIPYQYIVIDGLDEVENPPERRQILQCFTDLVDQCEVQEPGKLRVFIVSQDLADIRRFLEEPQNRVLSLNDVEGNKRDIELFTIAKTEKIREKFILSQEETEYIRDMTIGRSMGMFLYAKLVMENLYAQSTRKFLVEEIEAFPEGLGEAYARILNRIDKESHGGRNWKQAKRLLGWMICAKRQLSWTELQIALSMTFDEAEVVINYDNLRMHTHIHDICGSLVQRTGDRVHLVHSTAREYITQCTKDIHEASMECELATLCLEYLTLGIFEVDEESESVNAEIREQILDGYLVLQDYAISKWPYHVNAFIERAGELDGQSDREERLERFANALNDFMQRYQEDEEWEEQNVPECERKCARFENDDFYDRLLQLVSHIFKYYIKGSEARHKISLGSLQEALDRNRKLLEEFPSSLKGKDLERYREFHDDVRRYKCARITCRFFSEGFKDSKAQKKHHNIHERPFHCDAPSCLGSDLGFSNNPDLEKHKRVFHPEMTDLADTFNSNKKKAASNYPCSICGKTFTRRFHQRDHENSHRGEKPFACPECGRPFTRKNDLRRHQKLHDRK